VCLNGESLTGLTRRDNVSLLLPLFGSPPRAAGESWRLFWFWAGSLPASPFHNTQERGSTRNIPPAAPAFPASGVDVAGNDSSASDAKFSTAFG
jgi:hypothetical protein